MSEYTAPILPGIFQIKLETIGAPGALYVDNIYFYSYWVPPNR